MMDISHWDSAVDFSGFEAAALIQGVDPNSTDGLVCKPLNERLKRFYMFAREWHRAVYEDPLWAYQMENRRHEMLESIGLKNLCDDLSGHVLTEHDFVGELLGKRLNYENQRFTRDELVRWLSAHGLKSKYQFTDAINVDSEDGSDANDVDPQDFPVELDIANVAFRAVTNGFGDQTATFKNRLICYLETRHSKLSAEAIQRIATVANPVKQPGRKKSLPNA